MSEEIIDVDAPTPEDILVQAQEPEAVEDVPITKVLLEIKHFKGDNPEYVIRVSDPDTGELHGTLTAPEAHTASSFGHFMEYHLEAKGI